MTLNSAWRWWIARVSFIEDRLLYFLILMDPVSIDAGNCRSLHIFLKDKMRFLDYCLLRFRYFPRAQQHLQKEFE
ncbi:MAG: hypothetical protein IPP01_13175 [Saprospiraceae bacterium]|nr:hypothetical protein [Saprospiraceae bacterium]